MSAQQTASAGGEHRLVQGLHHQATAGLTVGAIVFLAAMAGILLRPSGHLSTFWAANAIATRKQLPVLSAVSICSLCVSPTGTVSLGPVVHIPQGRWSTLS